MEKLTGAATGCRPRASRPGATIDRDQFEPADHCRIERERRPDQCLVLAEQWLLGRHGFGPARPPSGRSWSCP